MKNRASIQVNSRHGEALGGGLLIGSKYVRLAYLDETGLSKREEERFAIVAGPLIHGDDEMLRLERELREIVARFPAQHQKNRFIHTAKMYGGYGEFTKANGWTEDLRFSVLDDVARLAGSIAGPVVYGFCDRESLHPLEIKHFKNEQQTAHVRAAGNCSVQIERIMRDQFPDEVTLLVMEDNQSNRQVIKEQHQLFSVVDGPHPELQMFDPRVLPLTKIRGTPHFEEKGNASLLQLADFCAVVIKRQFMEDPFIERFFGPIRKRIWLGVNIEGHPMWDPWDGPHV
jgi:hypothetical protein